MPPRIRKDVAQYLGYPLLDIPDDQKILTQKDALAKTQKISRSIQRLRKINTSVETG